MCVCVGGGGVGLGGGGVAGEEGGGIEGRKGESTVGSPVGVQVLCLHLAARGACLREGEVRGGREGGGWTGAGGRGEAGEPKGCSIGPLAHSIPGLMLS